MIVKCDSKGRIALTDFLDLIDTSKIKQYTIKPKKDGTILIKFYDKKGKLVRPYAKK